MMIELEILGTRKSDCMECAEQECPAAQRLAFVVAVLEELC